MSRLTVQNLDVTFATPNGPLMAVRDLHFAVGPRESLGIVGESGSGKSQACLAMLGLLADNGSARGSVRLAETELLNQPAELLRTIRGRRIGMVFQDPLQSLNPYLPIGRQLDLVLTQHRALSAAERRQEIVAMLDAVRIAQPERRLGAYPHEFSGGMRQRILLAMALLCRPEILIADEPTTALDVTVQADILTLINELRDAFGMGLVLITHDFGVVARSCDSVLVLENGALVEAGATSEVFTAPRHPCTQRLLAAVPRVDGPGPDTELPAGGSTLLDVDALSVDFRLPRRGFRRRETLQAVHDVSLSVRVGESVGIVGESGSGKSSLVRAIVGIVESRRGSVRLEGPNGQALLPGRDVQLIFQDPLASLNPRLPVATIVGEPLLVHEPSLAPGDRLARVLTMLERVGLDRFALERFPHEFSGGQCQRIAIARALITGPRLLLCDEALSSLDVSVQAEIVDLLLELQRELGLAMVFIAHDLAVVRRLCHRVFVMYRGRVVESGPAESIFTAPEHPYTQTLLAAVPQPDLVRERAR
ncbi:MAG: ABC transporter ATP-binding protein [Pseudomonadota bacterium]